MGFKRKEPRPERCNKGHRGSTIHSNGTYKSGEITFRQYVCTNRLGKKHYFSVQLTEVEGKVLATNEVAHKPSCPKHPDGHVVLNGSKGIASRRRQRYQCTPPDGSDPHSFFPPLPRTFVGGDFTEPCEVCEQALSRHLGPTYGAKRHTWPDAIIAQGLANMAAADAYGRVGRWAWDLHTRPQRRPLPPSAEDEDAEDLPEPTKHEETAESNRRWHIAADWVECFAPAIWRPLEATMRKKALDERRRINADLAAGKPLTKPIIWVLDEHPVMGSSNELFDVLVVAEYEWITGRKRPKLGLRVARALPDRTTSAWLLVLDELSGPAGPDEIFPDFVVADASPGILKALEIRYGSRTRWVPSLWHVGNAVRRAVTGKTNYGRLPNHQLVEEHLNFLTRSGGIFDSVETWAAWWDELERLFLLSGIKTSLEARRKLYQTPYAAVIPYLASGGWVAVSNAGIEELLKAWIKPLFAKRTTFTSIERTNNLIDLAVARSRGAFARLSTVARQIREDALPHDGWTVATRKIGDKFDLDTGIRYRSLRDTSFTLRASTERGLQ